jgi:hypothetical protein
VSDLPERFVPDGRHQLGGCPGCGEAAPPVEYNSIERDGARWHKACAYRRDEGLEPTDTPRRCPNCYAWGEWTLADAPHDVRKCDCCGRTHRGPTPEEFDGPAPPAGGEQP